MAKYYLGIDSSTSCTGIALIDENDLLIYSKCVNTKTDYQTASSLGQGFTNIYRAYDHLIKELSSFMSGIDAEAEYEVAIEANSFGGYTTTMLLGITIGMIHAVIKKYLKCIDISYSAVGNWRGKIVGNYSEDDLSNDGTRNQLKIAIMNWYERIFNTKLPQFTYKYDGIRLENGSFDLRINDISDAAGLAYCLKYNLLSDRKKLKIETKRQNNKIKTLKDEWLTYKKKVIKWKDAYDESKSNSDLKTLRQHLKTLHIYYDKLQEISAQTMTMEKWMNKHLKEIEDEINKI